MPWFVGAERDRRLAGQDAGPRLDRPARASAHRVDQLEAGPDGTLGVVLVGDRRAPDRHHRVADELLDGAAVAADDVAGEVEVARQELPRLLRVALLGERREADEVGEQDRHEAPLGDRRRRRRGAGAGPVGAPVAPAAPCPRAASAVRVVPHSPQNFAPAGFAAPQFGQPTAELRAPHSRQNFRPRSFSVPQLVQITPSPLVDGWRGYTAGRAFRDRRGSRSSGVTASPRRVTRRSAMRSTADSIPQERRIRASGTSRAEPATEAWVIVDGTSMSDSTPPSDSARVNSRVDAQIASARSRAVRAGRPAAAGGSRYERDHPSPVAHLAGGEAGLRVGVRTVGETGVADPLDVVARGEESGDGVGVPGVPIGPQGERPQAAQDEEAVERARAPRPSRSGGTAGARRPLAVRDRDPVDGVGMPAEVLRRRVEDDVGTEVDRPLDGRRGERVVDDDERRLAAGPGVAADASRRPPRCR